MQRMGVHEAVLAALAVALMLYAGAVDPTFVSMRAQALLSTHVWELAIVAVPMLLVVISGGIDLSVGATVALCAVAFGLLVEAGVPVAAAAPLAMALGAGAGALNGALVARLRVHPLIVTLATMAAFRGVAEGISLGRPLSGYPDAFIALAEHRILGVPLPGLVFLAFAGGAALVLSRGTLGRQIYAIGQGERAARFSGIPVDRIKTHLYALSGLACGLAAVLLVARNNTAKADLGMGLELEAVTCVVLGGARIEGGSGNVLGLALGLFLVHETREFVSWHWKQSELNLVVLGGVLLLSVLARRMGSREQEVGDGA